VKIYDLIKKESKKWKVESTGRLQEIDVKGNFLAVRD
jgi:hypothetical protein